MSVSSKFIDLTITQIIQPIKTTSSPWLVKCNNGKKYILKIFNGRDNSLPNEFLCNKIAKAMGLTVPETAIIYLTKDETDMINVTRRASNELPISPGKHYGLEYIENSYTLNHEIHRKLKPSKIKNIHEVPGMIVFDIFTANMDRDKTNALLHDLSGEQQIFEYVLIDHSSSFGGTTWDLNSIKNFQLSLGNIPWKHNFFIDDNQFKTYVEKLENLDKKFFKEIICQLPLEWNSRPGAYDMLLTTLNTRNTKEILFLIKKNKRALLIRNLRYRVPQIHRCLATIDNIKAFTGLVH